MCYLHWAGHSCDVALSYHVLDISNRSSQLLSEHAVSFLILNYRTNCWFASSLTLIQNICTWYPTSHWWKFFFRVFSHTLCFPVKTRRLCRANSISPFRCFSPSWPLLSCTASLTMCTLITSKNLLLSPLSFVLFPLFLRSSPVSKMLKSFFTLCCFSFSLALELTPAFPCAPLYTSSVWTTPLSHTYPKNPNSSALFLFQWVLLRVRDFFVVGMCLL